ncbi:preprotein translocase subunit SecG [Betaproteobacteria bacterium SCN1]|jgi:preprotein translocase subunit SecG|nr:preprotein translocase subunit SecG [Betaproteobacteria bacterium SCN1]MBN8759704.1 preprotein translocase subunit SecG [Thiobacillus sp.]ODU89600.1 MAG: preprotein translocase subunit SecG [Thiobacillus sp. SCN 65-179]OJW37526.1 MAG: preprotein translocase subunit SecG [Thiobacillus sp. 65-69]
METLVWIVHIIVAVAVVVLVLLQHGKGADMGAAFGSGSAGSLFGSSGSANFLSRSTAILATLFFLTSMGLAYYGLKHHKPSSSVTDRTTVPVPAQTVPAAPVPGGDSKAGDIPK